MNRKSVLSLTRGAVCAALYVLLTLLSFGMSSGAVQCRLSESLCLLPVFFPEAVPGLFLGCILSNVITGGNVIDTVFGVSATLIAAVITYRLRNVKHKWWLPLPTVVLNAAVVPFGILAMTGTALCAASYFPLVGTVFIGEFISAGILGYVCYRILARTRLFGKEE